jgi:hypothetical protein
MQCTLRFISTPTKSFLFVIAENHFSMKFSSSPYAPDGVGASVNEVAEKDKTIVLSVFSQF